MNKSKKVYIETYGCQMNFSDSEIVAAILTEGGYTFTEKIRDADILLINTCSIREHAEDRVRKRLHYFYSLRKKKPELIIGLLGCIAERTKLSLIKEEYLLDLVAGPDSYRYLPVLLEQADTGQQAVNTILSTDETYADITPVRLSSNGVSAFISIMRGCENYCSYCVVPSTRGKERSRDAFTIVNEARTLAEKGYREITLLGQNVNSYKWISGEEEIDFTRLLVRVAQVSSLLRIRFATSHPKDISEELLKTIACYKNICKSIHLPVQSGSNRILELMNRKYNREQYMELIEAIHRIIPDCAVSTDIITGFCSETDVDHQQTLELMKWARFDFAFMFKYSERPQTLAADQYMDNVPDSVKEQRLREIIDLQQTLSLQSNKRDLEKVFTVLIEGSSKRSADDYFGRTTSNKVVVFPKSDVLPGNYVKVKISHCTSATLIGEII